MPCSARPARLAPDEVRDVDRRRAGAVLQRQDLVAHGDRAAGRRDAHVTPQSHGQLDRAVARMRDAVEPRHHCVGVDLDFRASRRARAAEEQRHLGKLRACIEEEAPHRAARHRLERPMRRRVKRHHDDQHQRRGPMPGHHLERVPLAEHPPVVQSDDDVRHDLERGLGEVPKRFLEVRDRPLQVIHLLDGVLRADHVEHRRVDARLFHAPRRVARDERRVNGDAERGKRILDAPDRRVERAVLDLVPVVRAAGEEHPPRAGCDLIVDDAPQRLRRARRDHRLEDLRLAVVALQLAVAAGDRHGRPGALPAARDLARRKDLERRDVEVDRSGSPARLERADERRVEGRNLERLDAARGLEPGHPATSGITGSRRSRRRPSSLRRRAPPRRRSRARPTRRPSWPASASRASPPRRGPR